MSFFIPHLVETYPGLARAVVWLFLFDGVLIVGTVVSGFALLRSCARLTVAEAPRLAAATPFRRVHKTLGSVRRALVQSVALIAVGFFVALFTIGLPGELNELFVSVLGAGFLPLYLVVALFEVFYGQAADRIDELLKADGS